MNNRTIIVDLIAKKSYIELPYKIEKNYNSGTKILVPSYSIKIAQKKKKGNTMNSIAKFRSGKRYDVTPNDLLWANEIEGNARVKATTSLAITMWCNGERVSVITDSKDVEMQIKLQNLPINITVINK